ncbi:MAG TPA: DUF6152 family protein [Gammaproteobacteria bacterium]
MKLSFPGRNKIVLVWIIVVPALASAHHGISAKFDTQASIEITGEIHEVTWRNPHVLFTVTVTNDDGQETLWSAETLSMAMMRRNAISQDTLRPGEQVIIAGLPSLDGANDIYPTNMLLSDGREIVFNARVEPRWSDAVVGTSGPSSAREGDTTVPELGLFRVWSSTSATPAYYSSLNFDNNPLAARPRAVAAGMGQGQGTTATECAPKGMPSAMAAPYPMEFVRRGDDIVLRIEEYDAERVIHMTADGDADAQPSALLGYSTARWEGETLVVTTTQISSPSMGGGIRISPAAELVERFTPSPDGSRLDYQIAISDPGLPEPVVLEKFWLYVPGVTVQPYDCIPG